jgi:hypothetical protein
MSEVAAGLSGERAAAPALPRGIGSRGASPLRRALAISGSVGVLLVSLASFAPTSASAFVANGTIYCSPSPVVGVWVSAGSSSGWASFTTTNGFIASYSKNIGWHPTYHLTVGCGGTPSHWATSNYEGANLLEGLPWTVVCGGRGACYAFDVEAE